MNEHAPRYPFQIDRVGTFPPSDLAKQETRTLRVRYRDTKKQARTGYASVLIDAGDFNPAVHERVDEGAQGAS